MNREPRKTPARTQVPTQSKVYLPPAGAATPHQAKRLIPSTSTTPAATPKGSRDHKIQSQLTSATRETKLIASGAGVSDEIQELEAAGKIKKSGVLDLSKVVCDLCRSPYREEIEHRHEQGEPVARICDLFSITPQLLTKHMTHRQVTATLEASADSITEDILKWRTRIERLYAKLEGIFETIQSGLILHGYDSESGEPILSPATIKEIKPATDSMTKLMTEARQTIELFGRVNKLFLHERDSDIGGVTFVQIALPALDTGSKPVTLDAKTTTVDDFGQRAVQISGVNRQLPEYKGGELDEDKVKMMVSGLKGGDVVMFLDGIAEFARALDSKGTPGGEIVGVPAQGQVMEDEEDEGEGVNVGKTPSSRGKFTGFGGVL